MTMVLPLCRCICGSSRKDDFDPNRVLDTFDDHEEAPPPKQKAADRLAYSVTTDQQLRGVPIREGTLWLLSAEEEVASITLSLYVNGFSFTHRGREHSFSLSPFALVRNCKFQATTAEGVDLMDFKCFKVSLFTQGACFYFGIRAARGEEREVEEERSRWVIDISRAMRLVTQSLFPPFDIACEPLPTAPSTARRIMGGYLVHHDDVVAASVLYCELHPQQSSGNGDGASDHGKLVVYENELCQAIIMEIRLTERSTCCEKVGISCSCFSVEDHLFSARTLAERKLWLRAISNVKVKLQNRAPAPDEEELQQYRGAIREHIRAGKTAFQNHAPMDALLQRQPRISSQVIPDRSSAAPRMPVPVAAEAATATAARAAKGVAVSEPPLTQEEVAAGQPGSIEQQQQQQQQPATAQQVDAELSPSGAAAAADQHSPTLASSGPGRDDEGKPAAAEQPAPLPAAATAEQMLADSSSEPEPVDEVI